MLIKAEAIGINFIDTYFRSGLYPREVPFILGTEVCGTVEAVGDDVAALGVGDRVVTAQGATAPMPNTARRQPISAHMCRTVSARTWPPPRC